MCWFTAVILAHRRLRKEDGCEFEVSLDCIIRLNYKKKGRKKKKRKKQEIKVGRERWKEGGRKSGNRDTNIDFLPK